MRTGTFLWGQNEYNICGTVAAKFFYRPDALPVDNPKTESKQTLKTSQYIQNMKKYNFITIFGFCPHMCLARSYLSRHVRALEQGS